MKGQTPWNMQLAGIYVAGYDSIGCARDANKMSIFFKKSLSDKYY